jgi:hypothetical protein
MFSTFDQIYKEPVLIGKGEQRNLLGHTAPASGNRTCNEERSTEKGNKRGGMEWDGATQGT